MPINSQYNETVAVKRLADVEGTNKQSFSTHIASLACTIQPLDAQLSQDIEGGFGKDWLMFCPAADIQEGDRIIRGAKEYRITGIESLSFMGNSHMEVSIRIFES